MGSLFSVLVLVGCLRSCSSSSSANGICMARDTGSHCVFILNPAVAGWMVAVVCVGVLFAGRGSLAERTNGRVE